MRERDLEQLQQLRKQMEASAQAPKVGAEDPVEGLLEELRQDPDLSSVQLTPNFLNDVGYVLERDGFGAVEVYLLDRAHRQDTGHQARFVLDKVIPKLKRCPPVIARRALGRYVIKVLPALKERRQSHDPRAGVSHGGRSPGARPGGRRA